MKAALGLMVVIAALAACSSAGSTTSSRCRGIQLAGAFTAIPGSAGAGNIVYRLALQNLSSSSCTLTGLPQGVLLGKTGTRLPTHIRTAFPGRMPVLVRLAPGRFAYANARFSPDVPGTGDHTTGQCEPRAYWLQVEGINVKIAPATPVCERGTLSFSTYAPVKSS
ncbi:MAG TPA: DUF4232 domain-containing protein [Gaiellaceae bacterium]|nr:DUF4232 domain-containing protein [Gaiellaceae bacterium]